MLARPDARKATFRSRKRLFLRNWQDPLRVLLLGLSDSLGFFAALAIAYRYRTPVFGSTSPLYRSFNDYLLELLPIYLVVQLLLFAHYDLYSTGDAHRNYRKVTLAVTIGCILLYLWTNMYGVEWFSRGLWILFWLSSLALVPTGRWLIDKVVLTGIAQRFFLVIGRPDDYRKVEDVLQKINRSPYQYMGFVPISGHPGEAAQDGSLSGSLAQLIVLIEQHRIEEIFVIADLEKEQFLAVLDVCVPRGIKIYIFTDLLQALPNPVSINSINGLAIVEVHQPELRLSDATLKRILDLSLTFVGLLLAWWVFALIAIAIKLDSPGPVQFRQRRVGYKGREFTMYKFRTMVVDAEENLAKIAYLNERQDPLMFKIKDDPRITRVGRFLRRTSMDELPQLFNVLKGDMSLVGPRPPLPREVELYKEHHHQRLNVLPGITGMWQVSGRGEITDFEEVVRLDLFYIENWSLWLDFKILLKTIPAVFKARGAY